MSNEKRTPVSDEDIAQLLELIRDCFGMNGMNFPMKSTTHTLFKRLFNNRSAPNEPEVKAQGFEDWYKTIPEQYSTREIRIAKEVWQAAIQSIMPTPEEAKQYAQLERAILNSDKAPLSSRADCREFENWFIKQFNLPNYEEYSPLKEPCKAAFLAGQKSKAATLKLPEKKKIEGSFCEDGKYLDGINEGYNAAIDDMRKMYGLENV